MTQFGTSGRGASITIPRVIIFKTPGSFTHTLSVRAKDVKIGVCGAGAGGGFLGVRSKTDFDGDLSAPAGFTIPDVTGSVSRVSNGYRRYISKDGANGENSTVVVPTQTTLVSNGGGGGHNVANLLNAPQQYWAGAPGSNVLDGVNLNFGPYSSGSLNTSPAIFGTGNGGYGVLAEGPYGSDPGRTTRANFGQNGAAGVNLIQRWSGGTTPPSILGTLTTHGSNADYLPNLSWANIITLTASVGGLTTTSNITIVDAPFPSPSLSIEPISPTGIASGDPIELIAYLENSSGVINWTVSGGGTLSSTTGSRVLYYPAASGPYSAVVSASSGALNTSVAVAVAAVGTSGPELHISELESFLSGSQVSRSYGATLLNSASPINWSLSGGVAAHTVTQADIGSGDYPAEENFVGMVRGGVGTLNTTSGTAVVYTPPIYPEDAYRTTNAHFLSGQNPTAPLVPITLTATAGAVSRSVIIRLQPGLQVGPRILLLPQGLPKPQTNSNYLSVRLSTTEGILVDTGAGGNRNFMLIAQVDHTSSPIVWTKQVINSSGLESGTFSTPVESTVNGVRFSVITITGLNQVAWNITGVGGSAVANARVEVTVTCGGINSVVNLRPAPNYASENYGSSAALVVVDSDPSSFSLGVSPLSTGRILFATGFVAETQTVTWDVPSPTYVAGSNNRAILLSPTGTATATAGVSSGTGTIASYSHPVPARALGISRTSLTVASGGADEPLFAEDFNIALPITWTLTGPGTLSTTSGYSTIYTPSVLPGGTTYLGAVITASSGGYTVSCTVGIGGPPPRLRIAPHRKTMNAGSALWNFVGILENSSASASDISWSIEGATAFPNGGGQNPGWGGGSPGGNGTITTHTYPAGLIAGQVLALTVGAGGDGASPPVGYYPCVWENDSLTGTPLNATLTHKGVDGGHGFVFITYNETSDG